MTTETNDSPSGAELAAEVDAFLARTGSSAHRFNLFYGRSTNFLNVLRTAGRPQPWTVARVRKIIAEHPLGLPDPKPERQAGSGGALHRDPTIAFDRLPAVSVGAKMPTHRAIMAHDRDTKRAAEIGCEDLARAMGRCADDLAASEPKRRAGGPMTFEEQLAAVRRGAGLRARFRPERATDRTMAGVVGEINL